MTPRDTTSASAPHDLADDRGVRSLQHQPLSAGRVPTYAALGAAAGALPLPWVPDAIAKRVRGALAQDLAARHGLSLTADARAVLAEPSSGPGPKGALGVGVRFVARRVLGRLGPLVFLAPVRSAVETFTLGHLFARYLEKGRDERAARIDVDEARRVRHAIDATLAEVLRMDKKTSLDAIPTPPEDLRDAVTRALDSALMTAAGLPGWLVRRLDDAFDTVLARTKR